MSDFNDTIIEEFRANGGQVATAGFGDSLVLLHTTGAKSGAEHVSPAMAIPVDDGWLVAASKGGAPANPGWYHNLVANPDTMIEVGDKTVDVHAVDLQGDERDEAWARFTALAPGFSEYEKKAGDRVIPVIKLVRR